MAEKFIYTGSVFKDKKSVYDIILEDKNKSKNQIANTGIYTGSVFKDKQPSRQMTGAGYLGGSLGVGIASPFEGITDLVTASAAWITGDKDYAEYIYKNNVTGGWQNALDDKYQPGKGMQTAGEIAGGVGQAISYIAMTLLTSGIASGAAGGSAAASSAAAKVGTAIAKNAPIFLSATGSATGEAVQTTGELGGKEMIYGAAVGTMETGLEKLSAVGGIVGRATGKTGAMDKAFSKVVKNTVARGILSDAAGEFVEEASSELGSTWLKQLTGVDPEASTSAGQVLKAGLIGAASGAILGGMEAGTRAAVFSNTGAKLKQKGSAEGTIKTAQLLVDNIGRLTYDGVNQDIVDLKQSLESYAKSPSNAKLGEIASQMYLIETKSVIHAERAKILANLSEDTVTKVNALVPKPNGVWTMDDIRTNNGNIATIYATAVYANKLGQMTGDNSTTAQAIESVVVNDMGRVEQDKESTVEAINSIGADGNPNFVAYKMPIGTTVVVKTKDGYRVGVYPDRNSSNAEWSGITYKTAQEAYGALKTMGGVSVAKTESKPSTTADEGEKAQQERKPNPQHIGTPKKPTRKQIKKAKQQAKKESKLAEQKAKEEAEKKSAAEQKAKEEAEESAKIREEAFGDRKYTENDIKLCREMVEDFDFLPIEAQDKLLTTARTGRQAGANEQQIKEAIAFSHQAKTTIAFSSVIKADGMFTGVDNDYVIVVNPKDSRTATVIHEMAHRMKKTGNWDALEKYVRTVIGEEQFNAIRENYKKSYDNWRAEMEKGGTVVPELTDEQLDEEAVADALAHYLKKLPYLENKARKGFIQKAYASIVSIVKMIKNDGFATYKTAIRIKRAYEKMLTVVEQDQALREAKKILAEDDKRYSSGPISGAEDTTTLLDPRNLSEAELRQALENAQYGLYADNTYIPLRRNTPQFFIDVVNEHSNGAYTVEDFPIASSVKHILQNMEESDGRSYGNARPHNLSIDDIVTISRKMGDPTYIVLQENKRYAVVVSFYNKRNKKVIVSIDIAKRPSTPSEKPKNYKYAQYMNGYDEGYYNIVVTQYEPDSLESYLKQNEVVYDKKKMNGRYQVGSGRIVAVTHDTPFIEDIISHSPPIVNREFSEIDKTYLEAVNRGDMETAQRMVDEAAKQSMPESKITNPDGTLRKVYHGTNTGDFTVFNPDYIGMSSGDDGFFGKGFYFAYSEGEAKYYGAKRIISAYLDIKKPFDFQSELRMFNGERAVSGRAPDAVAFLNFAEKFPQLAKNITITVFNGNTGQDISLIDFAKQFRDVLEKKTFEYQTIKNDFGDTETIVLADKQEYTYEYDGETKTYYDYDFQKRFYGKANKIDAAYEYFSTVVYKHIDMYSMTRLILDHNDAFTQALKDRGYDGTIQSEEGDEAVAFYPEQIKSADPVTYDDNGGIIPLSERFDASNPDIRYSPQQSASAPDPNNPFDHVDTTMPKKEKLTLAQARAAMKEFLESAQVELTNQQAAIENFLVRRGKMKRAEAASWVQAVRTSEGYGIGAVTTGQYSADGKRVGDGLFQILSPLWDKKNGTWNEKLYHEFAVYITNLHNIDRQREDKPVIPYTNEEITEKVNKLKSQLEDALLQAEAEGKSEREKAEIEAEYTKKIRDIERPYATEMSQKAVEQYERQHPEFKAIAEQLSTFNRNLNQYRVDTGLLSQKVADELNTKYPHYIPTYRVEDGMVIGTGSLKGKYNFEVQQSVKTAKGSDKTVDNPILTYIHQTISTYKAGRVNQLLKLLHDNADGEFVVTEESKKPKTDLEADDETGATEYGKAIDITTNELTYWDNGKKVTIRAHKNIFAGFEGFTTTNTSAISSMIVKGFAKVNNLFKAAVTSWNPFFLATNFFKDTGDALFYSKFGAKAWAGARVRAQKMIHENHPLWQEYISMGGLQSSIYDFEQGFSGNLNDRGMLRKAKMHQDLQQRVENVNIIIEQASRFTEYVLSRESGLSVRESMLNAADVTINFSRGGRLVKVANKTFMPFLNPAVQGMSKIGRTFFEDRTKGDIISLVLKCVALGILPMMLANLMYGNDEEYDDLQDTVKENNYLFRFGDTWIKIPKGRVQAVLSGAYNRTERALSGKSVDVMDYLSNVAAQATPLSNISRTIISPFKDVQTNTTWYGGSIETQGDQLKAPKDRYDEYTSELSKGLAKVIPGTSPKKWDYFLDQTTGVIGDILLPATTANSNALQAFGKMGTNRFIVNTATSSRISSEFYDIYEKTTYKKSAGDEEAYFIYKYLSEYKDAATELYDQIDAIQVDESLSTADKNAQSKALRVFINQTYKSAITDLETYKSALSAAMQGVKGAFSVVEITQDNRRQYDCEKDDIGRYAVIYNDQKYRMYDTLEEADKYVSNMGNRMIYAESIRLVYGAERAIKSYNSSLYEKAQALNSLGIGYEIYYNAYFGTNGMTKKETEQYIASLGLSKSQRNVLMYALGYSSYKKQAEKEIEDKSIKETLNLSKGE